MEVVAKSVSLPSNHQHQTQSQISNNNKKVEREKTNWEKVEKEVEKIIIGKRRQTKNTKYGGRGGVGGGGGKIVIKYENIEENVEEKK